MLSRNGQTLPEMQATILLLDDEPDITSIMSVGLKSAGFAVDAFNDPIEALSHFEAVALATLGGAASRPKAYDLVISDIRMAGMSGFDFARKVNAIDSKVRIMLVTAYEVKKEEFDKVIPSLRIDALINKPISMTRLNDLVSALLISKEEPAKKVFSI